MIVYLDFWHKWDLWPNYWADMPLNSDGNFQYFWNRKYMQCTATSNITFTYLTYTHTEKKKWKKVSQKSEKHGTELSKISMI